MSLSEVRTQLAQQQGDLVRALLGQGELPAGFDVARVQLAARSLVNKRIREVARVWPALSRCLGDRFAERFKAFAQRTTPPSKGGPMADGRAFLATLREEDLDDEARMEVLSRDLGRWSMGMKTKWLPGARRLVLGVRLPWLGMRMVSVRWRGKTPRESEDLKGPIERGRPGECPPCVGD